MEREQERGNELKKRDEEGRERREGEGRDPERGQIEITAGDKGGKQE